MALCAMRNARDMKLRIFGHYIFFPLVLLGFIELIAVLFACWLGTKFAAPLTGAWQFMWGPSALLAACVFASMMALGLYNKRHRDRLNGTMLRAVLGVFVGGVFARSLAVFWPDLWSPLSAMAGSMVLACALLLLTRVVGQRVMDGNAFRRRILVLGAGRFAARVLHLRRRSDQRAFKLIGFVAVQGDHTAVPVNSILKHQTSLIELTRLHRIDEIVIAIDDRRRNYPVRELLNCRLAGVEISELASFLERETGKVFLDIVNPSWIILGAGFRCSWLRRASVRTVDILASLLILLIGLPFMVLVVLAIKIEDGLTAPVMYMQERVGQGGFLFNVFKFRSMHLNAEDNGEALWAQPNDSRVTRVGAIIRKTRLDELPQLINVISGNMSFVGPRPERPSFVVRLSEKIPYYPERHSVKPGITGWAQLCYPYGASDQDAFEKLQYDLFYVKNHGLFFDLMILLQTVEVIVFGKGAR
jgi:sugar transferase (PEP-CTERM system associated)